MKYLIYFISFLIFYSIQISNLPAIANLYRVKVNEKKFITFYGIKNNSVIKIYKIPENSLRDFLTGHRVFNRDVIKILKKSPVEEKIRISLQTLSPGLYQIQLKNKIKNVLVSDINMVCFSAGNNVILWGLNSKTNSLISDATVEIFNNKFFTNFRINQFPVITSLPSGKYTILFKSLNNFTFQKIEVLPFSKEKKKIHVHVFPQVYHTGEYAIFPVILFDNISQEKIRYKVISQETGNILLEREIDLIEGRGEIKFLITEEFQPGDYILWVEYKKDVITRKFKVIQKRRCNYIILLQPSKRTYFYGEKIQIKGKVYKYFGAPVKEAVVKCFIYAKPYGESKYRFLKVINDKVDDGKFLIKYKPENLKQNNKLKFIFIITGKNGISEGDFVILNYIIFPFNISLTSRKNIYNKGETINMEYIIEPSYKEGVPEKIEFSLYKILEYPDKIKLLERQKLKFKSYTGIWKKTIKNTGYYRFILKVKDKISELEVKKKKEFIVYSEKTGVSLKRKRVLVFPDKSSYDYSDIARILILFPVKDVWFNLSIISHKVIDTKLFYSEFDFFTVDFPVSEDFSPQSKIIVNYSTHLSSKFAETSINVPLLNKRLKFKTTISNFKSWCNTENKINILPLNYWNYPLDTYLFSITGSYGFFEVYNQNIIDYFKIWYPPDILPVFTGKRYIKRKKTMNKKRIKLPLFNSKYMKKDKIDITYGFFYKKEEAEINFKYPDFPAKWLTVIYGFAPDGKTGVKVISHYSEKIIDADFIAPDYMYINDRIEFVTLLRNWKIVPQKIRQKLEIINGSYKFANTQKFFIPANNLKEIFVKFKPVTARTTKISLLWLTPYNKILEKRYIDVLKPPAIEDYQKKEDLIKIKKRYYVLKLKERNSKVFCRKSFFSHKSFDWGEDVLVNLKIEINKNLRNLKIEDFIPAGFKYINSSGYKISGIYPDLNYRITMRRDKIYIYIPFIKKGEHNLYYIIKAVLPGEFYFPGIKVYHKGKLLASFEGDYYLKIKR